MFPYSLAIAFALGIVGYVFIYGIERNVKAFIDLLSPKTRLSKKSLYIITSINFFYFGIGCALMFFNVSTF